FGGGEHRLETLAQQRRRLRRGDQLREWDRLVRIAPQAHVERSALGKLRIGAAEERRADEMTRAREVDRREGKLEQRERRIDQRIGGKRLTERDVEGERRLSRLR